MNDKEDRSLAHLKMALRQHLDWVKAQKAGGYSCKVIDLKTREVIDEGKPTDPGDGLVRH